MPDDQISATNTAVSGNSTTSGDNSTQTAQAAAVATPASAQTAAAPVGIASEHEHGEGHDKDVNKVLTSINRDFKEKQIKERAKELKIEYVEIGKTPINPDLLKIIDYDIAKNAFAIPFLKVGYDLRLAIVDPEKAETKALMDELKAKGFILHLALTSDDSFADGLKMYEYHKKFTEKKIETTVSETRQAYDKELEVLADLKEKVEKMTSEEALNIIEVGAIKTNASDMHYEPGAKDTRIRFRIDGVLHTIFHVSNAAYANMTNQLKYRCKMKLNITNIPQDGRYAFAINERKIDVRVSSIPTEFGESFVCRLLDSGKHFTTFEELGYEGKYLEKMNNLANLSYGMVLVTGPTGSGKTTTLYSLLTKFNDSETKIITLEDPIEYRLEGIVQSQIDVKRGYDFAGGLKTLLRQDPDVVMIGEIRDLDTANAAAQASLTGHVLLSTLHTNTAIEAIPRLVNMGLQEFMIAPSLHTVIAQRLARRVCPNCVQKKPISDSDRAIISKNIESIKIARPDLNVAMPTELVEAVGCEKCSKTGYLGRVVVCEMIEIDNEIKEAILNKMPAFKILEIARKKGMTTMQEDGILKVIEGATTMAEVFRVTNS
ncbi:MAG: type IV-A pilus assembly ATPase PilB, type IV pilus assembly protein PilB [Candidatus Peregrinibacteria bacterium GW2011_GWF2_38_29]|nr:MAG: type IV-A pilus assembly ATPase PilB, type IV pilus assembly protein PilB [Candidatus Peregrinibacteria bacterium GW2011_GWF2_38_29]HBB02861.1 hypothetical protein [Candidatus Peregrinibacteria bacterium]